MATNSGAYSSGRTIAPTGAVNHSVGCAQPSAEVFYNAMNQSGAKWAVNAIIGDFHKGEGRIILSLRFNKDAKTCSRNWGVGKGKRGTWNDTRIQWEICEPAGHTYAGGTMIGYDVAKNQGYFDRMWKLVVAWNVYCAKVFGYTPDMIGDHAESYRAGYGGNHADVGHWWTKHGKSMDALRAEVKAILDSDTEDEDMDKEKFAGLFREMRKDWQDNDAGDWSKPARDWGVATGLITGGGTTDTGEPNYMWHDLLTREQFIVVLHRLVQMVDEA